MITTIRQQIAYSHPCARAYDTLAPEFRYVFRLGKDLWSTILTVNK